MSLKSLANNKNAINVIKNIITNHTKGLGTNTKPYCNLDLKFKV